MTCFTGSVLACCATSTPALSTSASMAIRTVCSSLMWWRIRRENLPSPSCTAPPIWSIGPMDQIGGAVQDGEGRFSRRILHHIREEHTVLIAILAEVDRAGVLVAQQAKTLPVKQVMGHSHSDPWSSGRECRIHHHP